MEDIPGNYFVVDMQDMDKMIDYSHQSVDIQEQEDIHCRMLEDTYRYQQE
jgi:hypothetical protein